MPPELAAPAYLEPYHRAIESHGNEFPALLHASAQCQRQRFAVLGNTMALAGRNIADLGAGHGDLAHWLVEQGIEYQRYVGVDAVSGFVERAEERRQAEALPRAHMLEGDFVRDRDLLPRLVAEYGIDTFIFCGSLNTLRQVQARDVLTCAYSALASRPGSLLAYNFLAGGDEFSRLETDLPRRDSAEWVAWALAQTPYVTFCQGYLGTHDGTIVMMVPLA